LLNVIANPDYKIVRSLRATLTVSCLKYIYFLFFQTVLSHLNSLDRLVDKNIVSDHFSKNLEVFLIKRTYYNYLFPPKTKKGGTIGNSYFDLTIHFDLVQFNFGLRLTKLNIALIEHYL